MPPPPLLCNYNVGRFQILCRCFNLPLMSLEREVSSQYIVKIVTNNAEIEVLDIKLIKDSKISRKYSE